MKNIIKNYKIIQNLVKTTTVPQGSSASPKELFAHIFNDNSQAIQVLDIGFGNGSLGRLIKTPPPHHTGLLMVLMVLMVLNPIVIM